MYIQNSFEHTKREFDDPNHQNTGDENKMISNCTIIIKKDTKFGK